ncbi:MAG: pyruvate oxidase [Gammaproteobacteria bacterium]|nr:pyruvate oxidase [Gammaproteobacteria bacterium]MCH9744061.1 pyruvate oxidase [Gammaproteobacteria bacterium]
MSKKSNVFEMILNILDGVSQRQIFGVFGDAINPLAAALRKDDGKRFEWIGVRHEESGAFAASAQAKMNGKIGLCAGTVGPGAIHLLNGLYDAKKDHAPVLAITGQVPRTEIGSGYHQEVNLDRLFDDVCVYNQTMMVPEQMPRIALLAAQKALAYNSVSHLSIPSDIGAEDIDNLSLDHPVFQADNNRVPCKKEMEALAEKLNGAAKVTLLIGWGSRHASQEVISLAEKLKAPIAHALKGKMVVPDSNPHYADGIGMLGSTCGLDALDSCDVLLMLGTDFPYRQFYPKNKYIIQIDADVERLGQRCGIKMGLVGHIKPTLTELLPMIEAKTDDSHLVKIQKSREKWMKTLSKRAAIHPDKHKIHPQSVVKMVSEHARADAAFTADTGETIVWTARHLQQTGGRDFIACFNLASMANAMPQALGIQALDRKRQVIALCGDGGFSMLMSDFITAVSYNLPIKCFVFNNSALGLVKMEMEATGYAEWGVHLKNPSFADCGKAMGGEGILITEPSELEAGVKRALSMDGPVVVDIHTNRDELTIPPKIEAARAWGYSISKMKELWSPYE